MKVGVLASGNRRPPLSQSDLWVLRQRPYRRMSAWRFLSGNCPAQTGPPAGITVVTFCSLWPSFCRRVAAHSSGTQVDEVSKGCGFRSPSRGPPP